MIAYLLKGIKYILAYTIGFLLFVFILSYLIITFFSRRIKVLFKIPELYHFREQQFTSLDVTLKGDESRILLGRLPSIENEVKTYNLPAQSFFKEVLLELKITTKARDLEIDYEIYINEFGKKNEHFFFFINALSDAPKENYNHALCWFPIPENRIFYAKLTSLIFNQPATAVYGTLNIVRWR